jgi:hypothetical protein
MTVINKIKPLLSAYWFALLLLFITLALFGRDAIVWLIMKLYDIFIQRNPDIF